MASSLLKNLPKFDIVTLLVILALFGGLYYAWVMYTEVKLPKSENMIAQQQMSMKVEPAPVEQTSMTSNSDYTESATLSGADLLPKDSNSEWNNLNLEKNANGVVMPDMLQAGVHQGLDTVGSVLRNANQQLRPDPPIPKSNAGLCNVNLSTIEPDSIRGDMKIGCGC
tara:strand:- start:629 stop:1132 length:504 start_codon:yes stop_codon:yes gene_type:complete